MNNSKKKIHRENVKKVKKRIFLNRVMSLKDIDRKNLTRLVKKLTAVKVTRIQATYKKENGK